MENSFSNIPEKSYQLSQSIEQDTYEKEKSILTEEFRTLSLVDDEDESLAPTNQTDFIAIQKTTKNDIIRMESMKTPLKWDKNKLSKSFSIQNTQNQDSNVLMQIFQSGIETDFELSDCDSNRLNFNNQH